jgi:hypothetical protein
MFVDDILNANKVHTSNNPSLGKQQVSGGMLPIAVRNTPMKNHINPLVTSATFLEKFS